MNWSDYVIGRLVVELLPVVALVVVGGVVVLLVRAQVALDDWRDSRRGR